MMVSVLLWKFPDIEFEILRHKFLVVFAISLSNIELSMINIKFGMTMDEYRVYNAYGFLNYENLGL